MTPKMKEKWFTPATVFEAEGTRAGLVVCRLCGAAILIDRRESIDAANVHISWHIGKNETMQEEAGR